MGYICHFPLHSSAKIKQKTWKTLEDGTLFLLTRGDNSILMQLIMPHGGLPPQSIGDNSSEGDDDGWVFWTKVYEDPELRNQLSQKAQNAPTVSELLRSDELCRGELLFLNVPRVGTGQQAVIRSLLNTQIGRNLPLLDIVITNRRWKVRFYRLEDAQEVQRRLDGYRFKHKYLIVRFATSADGVLSDYPLIMNKLKEMGIPTMNDVVKSLSSEKVVTPSLLPSPPPPVTTPIPEIHRTTDPSWTPSEMAQLESFKCELIVLLQRNPIGMYSVNAVDELRKMRRKGVVAVALDSWATGLLRLYSPHVKMTGKYVSLNEHDNHKILLAKTANEGSPRIPIDEWEPMPPSNVRNNYHLTDYMTAFLNHFGPQHIKVDVPLRLLVRTLPGSWPSSAVELSSLIMSFSPSFVVFDDVLYLATNVRHRRILLDQLQPPKPRYSTVRVTNCMTSSDIRPSNILMDQMNDLIDDN